jgi:hypothetical protein
MIAKTHPSLVATWLQQLAKTSRLHWDLKELFVTTAAATNILHVHVERNQIGVYDYKLLAAQPTSLQSPDLRKRAGAVDSEDDLSPRVGLLALGVHGIAPILGAFGLLV